MKPSNARRGAAVTPADTDVYELTADDWEIPEEWKPAAAPPRGAQRAAQPNAPLPWHELPLGAPSVRHKA